MTRPSLSKFSNVFAPCLDLTTRRPVTSDHAPRKFEFIELNSEDKVLLSLTAATWNMQDRCISKQSVQENNQRWNDQNRSRPPRVVDDKAYGNNPMDISETDETYLERKRAQISELQGLMKNTDVIFLQEADWVRQRDLRQEYTKMLEEEGWAMCSPSRDMNCAKLVTLYKKDTLAPLSGPEGCFCASTGQHRGMQVNFNCKKYGNRPVALVNLHLLYGTDYRDSIPFFQQDMVNRDVPCIMGGDLNNFQNGHVMSALGHWHAASNFEFDLVQKRYITEHKIEGSPVIVQKAYDAFMAGPTRSSRMRCTDLGGKVFLTDPRTGELQCEAYNPEDPQWGRGAHHTVHESEIGYLWIPQKRREDFKRCYAEYSKTKLQPPAVGVGKDTVQSGLVKIQCSNRSATNPTGSPDKTPEDQAREILARARVDVARGYDSVGLTYAANHEQTQQLWKDYGGQTGSLKWANIDSTFDGRGQAEVVKAIRELLKNDFSDLQGKFYILPISTSPEKNRSTNIPRCLDYISNFVQGNSDRKSLVYGWVGPTGAYLLGGAIAAPLTDSERNLVNNCLGRLQDPVTRIISKFHEKCNSLSEGLKKTLSDSASAKCNALLFYINRYYSQEGITVNDIRDIRQHLGESLIKQHRRSFFFSVGKTETEKLLEELVVVLEQQSGLHQSMGKSSS